MKLSISTEPLTSRFSIQDVLSMVSRAGFDAVDLGLFSQADVAWLAAPDYRAHAEDIKTTADRFGIQIGQIHAPFPSYFHGDEAKTEAMRGLIRRSLEAAEILACPVVIVHPVTVSAADPMFADHRAMREANLSLYRSLLPTARDAGVAIALENLFGYDAQQGRIVPCYSSDVDDLLDMHAALGAGMTVCLDVGHSILTGQDIVQQIRTLGDNLTALHIQSNDAVVDLHTLPYFHNTIDWSALMQALREVGYGGNFNLEVFGYFADIPDPLVPAALRYAAQTAAYVTKGDSPC